MGVYPEVTLADARARRDAARRLIAAGTDPSDHRKATKATQGQVTENTFEAVAREWLEKFKPRWAATHSSKIIRRLEVDLFPWLGRRPIAEISAPEVLKCVHRVEGRGAKDTAHRALQNAGHGRAGLPVCGGNRARRQRSDPRPAWRHCAGDSQALCSDHGAGRAEKCA